MVLHLGVGSIGIGIFIWVGYYIASHFSTYDHGDRPSNLLLLGLLAAIVAGNLTVVSGAFTYLRLSAAEVSWRGLLWRRRSVDLREVLALEPGYMGMQIRTSKGHSHCAFAVQESNWRILLGRPSRKGEEVQEFFLELKRVG
jgi:hypothetical protein